MKILFPVILSFCILSAVVYARQDSPYNDVISKISKQLLMKAEKIGLRHAEYTVNGEWKSGDYVNWFSGFLPGELWYMYDLTGNEKFKDYAIAVSDNLRQYSNIDFTHDMGFIFYPSCVKAYQETGDKKFRDAALQAAEMLAKRFNKNGNFIRAWGSLNDPDRAGWMIIDTMMNLELLFWAAKETGNQEYYDIAYKHALTTLKETVRGNFSSYHVVEFDTETGEVTSKHTHQGYKDESTWGRGQAWGIYGFANAYKYTGDEKFLEASMKMADYFLANIPPDLIPVWDLDLVNNPGELRDASAGAIAASGMFILSEQCKTKEESSKYLAAAKNITKALTEKCLYTTSTREKEEGILLHIIYHYHNKWGVDESFPAGDYYYIEAVSKLLENSN